ncbi:hypothetical protein ES703_27638 [subsurface metagenome]
MKNTYTVKEVMDGTGLTRQRVHALIRSRDIPVHTDKNKFIIKWGDLLKMADNTSMLNFIRDALQKEKHKIDDGYKALRENAKGMMYAYMLLLEKELPTPEGEDLDWIRLFRKAYYYWWQMTGGCFGCHWALEADKYDYLDEEDP